MLKQICTVSVKWEEFDMRGWHWWGVVRFWSISDAQSQLHTPTEEATPSIWSLDLEVLQLVKVLKTSSTGQRMWATLLTSTRSAQFPLQWTFQTLRLGSEDENSLNLDQELEEWHKARPQRWPHVMWARRLAILLFWTHNQCRKRAYGNIGKV